MVPWRNCPLDKQVIFHWEKKVFRFWKKNSHTKKIPISQSRSTLCQSDWRNWSQLAQEPNSLRVLTKQANDSWRACFASWAPPPQHGYKRRAVYRHTSAFRFGAEPFSANLRECLQTAIVLVLWRVSGVCCPVLLLLFWQRAAALHSAVALWSPLGASALFLKEQF